MRTWGRASRISAVASMPLRRGIRTSMSTTSGMSSWARSTAWWPSAASPTTSMSGSESRTIWRPRRNRAWSSTIRTLSRSISPSLRRCVPDTFSRRLRARAPRRYAVEPGASELKREDFRRLAPASTRRRMRPRRSLTCRSRRCTTWSRADSTSGEEAEARNVWRGRVSDASTVFVPSSRGWSSEISSSSTRVALGSTRASFPSLCSAVSRSASVIRTPLPFRTRSMGTSFVSRSGSSHPWRRCGAATVKTSPVRPGTWEAGGPGWAGTPPRRDRSLDLPGPVDDRGDLVRPRERGADAGDRPPQDQLREHTLDLVELAKHRFEPLHPPREVAAVRGELRPGGPRRDEVAEEQLEHEHVRPSGRLGVHLLQPGSEDAAARGRDAVQHLVRPIGLGQRAGPGQASRDQAREHLVDLAPGRPPQVADASP